MKTNTYLLIALANLELCTMGLDHQEGRSEQGNSNLIVCVCSAYGAKPALTYTPKIPADHISMCLIQVSTVYFHPFPALDPSGSRLADSIAEFQIWMVFGINECSDLFYPWVSQSIYSFPASLLRLQDAIKYDGKDLRLLLNRPPQYERRD